MCKLSADGLLTSCSSSSLYRMGEDGRLEISTPGMYELAISGTMKQVKIEENIIFSKNLNLPL
jgi:hypothetical protein